MNTDNDFIRNPPAPSLGFCITGWLQPGERYHQDSHSYERLIRNRAPNILDLYNMEEISQWVLEHSGFIRTNLTYEQIEEIENLTELNIANPSDPSGSHATTINEVVSPLLDNQQTEIRPPTPPLQN